MEHIHVAALEHEPEFAKKIGKRAGESDFAVYNCKESGKVLCLYHPFRHPEKIQPLLYCLEVCDIAYFRPNAIDKAAGEIIVAASVFGKRLLVIPDLVGKADLEPLFKAAGLTNYEFFEGDSNALREKLLSENSTRKKDGNAEVLIDSCFPVKGVGTVALGIVDRGMVKKHQKLHFMPSGNNAEVKSIQVQDEDVKEAEAGSRVGLCLKGIEDGKISKGEVAAEEKFESITKFEAEFSPSRLFRGKLESAQFFALKGFAFAVCKAEKKGDKYIVEAGTPIPARNGDSLALFVPEIMPRVIGKARVVWLASQ